MVLAPDLSNVITFTSRAVIDVSLDSGESTELIHVVVGRSQVKVSVPPHNMSVCFSWIKREREIEGRGWKADIEVERD